MVSLIQSPDIIIVSKERCCDPTTPLEDVFTLPLAYQNIECPLQYDQWNHTKIQDVENLERKHASKTTKKRWKTQKLVRLMGNGPITFKLSVQLLLETRFPPL